MIFGKTDKEKAKIASEHAKRRAYGVKKYAWLPTVLENGQWIWLQPYYRFRFAHVRSYDEWVGGEWYGLHYNHAEWDKKHIKFDTMSFGDQRSAKTMILEHLLDEFGDSGPK